METHLTTFIMLDLLFMHSHMSFILMWVYNVRWYALSGILLLTLTTRFARKVKSTRKTKCFCRIIWGGIYYIIISPQLSIWIKFLFARTRNPLRVCLLSRGEGFLHDTANKGNCIQAQRNVFVIFVKGDERDRHGERKGCNRKHSGGEGMHSPSKSNPLVILMKRASERTNESAPW